MFLRLLWYSGALGRSLWRRRGCYGVPQWGIGVRGCVLYISWPPSLLLQDGNQVTRCEIDVQRILRLKPGISWSLSAKVATIPLVVSKWRMSNVHDLTNSIDGVITDCSGVKCKEGSYPPVVYIYTARYLLSENKQAFDESQLRNGPARINENSISDYRFYQSLAGP